MIQSLVQEWIKDKQPQEEDKCNNNMTMEMVNLITNMAKIIDKTLPINNNQETSTNTVNLTELYELSNDDGC